MKSNGCMGCLLTLILMVLLVIGAFVGINYWQEHKDEIKQSVEDIKSVFDNFTETQESEEIYESENN